MDPKYCNYVIEQLIVKERRNFESSGVLAVDFVTKGEQRSEKEHDESQTGGFHTNAILALISA